MLFLATSWIGCSSSNGTPGGTGAQTCRGSTGDEYCACDNTGSCKSGLTCAIDLQMCVHLAGTSASGGRTGSGGDSASTGGSSGGATGSGGFVSTGGTGAGGGARATGGASGGASGGMTGSGGRSTGGSTGAGNAPGSGGMTGSGGSPGSGGVTATSCSGLMPSASGNGEFTHYNFGQGTAKGEQGMYQTACGYLGSESGQTDTVQNIANMSPAKNTYFAAIPGNSSSDFNTRGYCGTCVQISNGGHTIIATIIDECPGNSNPICQRDANGELDLSVDAFNALGFGSNGNPTGTSWKAVPCPVSGNVVVRIKQSNEAYIENSILAIKSVSGPGGSASRTSYGSWHFNSNIGSGSQLTLTDAADRTIQVTLSSGATDQNQDTGKQFPTCQ
jgi:hypothetical protein